MNKVETASPLGTGPVALGNRLFVGSHDGCLYEVEHALTPKPGRICPSRPARMGYNSDREWAVKTFRVLSTLRRTLTTRWSIADGAMRMKGAVEHEHPPTTLGHFPGGTRRHSTNPRVASAAEPLMTTNDGEPRCPTNH